MENLNNSMEKYIEAIKKTFKRKTRVEIVEDKIDRMIEDLFNSGYSNYEISVILKNLSTQGKGILKERAEALEKEIMSTVTAINYL